MRYCDYSFYKYEYSGTMPESLFNRLSITASAKIKANTFDRIANNNIPDAVKYCVCVICDEFYKIEKADGKSSESVGSWSVSYNKTEDKELNKKINSIINNYLSGLTDSKGIPLLYRGC